MPIPVLDFRRLSSEENSNPLSSILSGLLGGVQNAEQMKSKRLSDMLVQKQMEEHDTRSKYLEPSLQAELALKQGQAKAQPGQLQHQEKMQQLAQVMAQLQAKQNPQKFEQDQGLKRAQQQRIEQQNQYYPQELELKERALQGKLDKGKGKENQLTQANVTKNQGMIQSIDSVLPLIESLDPEKSPGRRIGKYFKPNDEAQYQGKTAAIADILISALGLPKTDSSLHLVNKIITRQPGEFDTSYKKRLKELVTDLKSRKNKSVDSIKNGVMGSGKNWNYDIESGVLE